MTGIKAELIFVGTELLLGEILNTNAQYLSQRLAELGIDCYYQVTVGDNAARLAGVLRQSLGRAEVVIATGGLGPTMDDITKETVARVLGLPLELHPPSLERIEETFRRLGRPMSENNRKQALTARGARVLPNDRGTAPGMAVGVPPDWTPERSEAPGWRAADAPPAWPPRRVVIVLPGPPREMVPMFEEGAVPVLLEMLGGEATMLIARTLRFVGIGESDLEHRIRDLMAGQTDPFIAPYAKLGEVHLRLSTKAADRAAGLARIAPVEAAIRERVGGFCYGTDDQTLEQVVGEELRARAMTLAVAESCTGGLLSKRLTDVPGSSDYFLAGLVTYSNAAKESVLAVPAATLGAHGAVSDETALAMAAGARQATGADVAVSVTGIAGPGGGSAQKPVGTVHIAVDGPKGPWVRRHRFPAGDRAAIRERSAQEALNRLWRYLRLAPPHFT